MSGLVGLWPAYLSRFLPAGLKDQCRGFLISFQVCYPTWFDYPRLELYTSTSVCFLAWIWGLYPSFGWRSRCMLLPEFLYALISVLSPAAPISFPSKSPAGLKIRYRWSSFFILLLLLRLRFKLELYIPTSETFWAWIGKPYPNLSWLSGCSRQTFLSMRWFLFCFLEAWESSPNWTRRTVENKKDNGCEGWFTGLRFCPPPGSAAPGKYVISLLYWACSAVVIALHFGTQGHGFEPGLFHKACYMPLHGCWMKLRI